MHYQNDRDGSKALIQKRCSINHPRPRSYKSITNFDLKNNIIN